MVPRPIRSRGQGDTVKNFAVIVIMMAAIVCMLSFAAQAQVPVNIVYPINGATYPLADINPMTRTVASAYITVSFGTTCEGGGYKMSWGFDSTTLGSGTFYDQASVQQVYKLPAGKHSFWVRSDCGKDSVKIVIK